MSHFRSGLEVYTNTTGKRTGNGIGFVVVTHFGCSVSLVSFRIVSGVFGKEKEVGCAKENARILDEFSPGIKGVADGHVSQPGMACVVDVTFAAFSSPFPEVGTSLRVFVVWIRSRILRRTPAILGFVEHIEYPVHVHGRGF